MAKRSVLVRNAAQRAGALLESAAQCEYLMKVRHNFRRAFPPRASVGRGDGFRCVPEQHLLVGLGVVARPELAGHLRAGLVVRILLRLQPPVSDCVVRYWYITCLEVGMWEWHRIAARVLSCGYSSADRSAALGKR